jgi:predicted GIY-YIG superfamily endonuclease
MKKPCIYCIKVDNYIAYIGKSIDFESRLQNHWYNLFKSDKNKYLLLKSALFRKHSLSFWIIGEYKEEELDEKE